jgi:hypothetical protein
MKKLQIAETICRYDKNRDIPEIRCGEGYRQGRADSRKVAAEIFPNL